jgi:hypothetical protein
MEETLARPRAADDFAAIRERMEELRRERAQLMREQVEPIADDRQPRNKGATPIGRPEIKLPGKRF